MYQNCPICNGTHDDGVTYYYKGRNWFICFDCADECDTDEQMQNIIDERLNKEFRTEKERRYKRIMTESDIDKVIIDRQQEQIKELSEQINKLNADMNSFVMFMMDKMNQLAQNSQPKKRKYEKHQVEEKEDTTLSAYRTWRVHIEDMLNEIMANNIKYKTQNDVLNDIYRYMTKNYGIVWEEEIRAYKDENNISFYTKKLDVVFNRDMLKSIFEARLMDMVGYDMNEEKIEDTLDYIIMPLANKRNDKSRGYTQTYHMVYKYMTQSYGIHWQNHETRYRNKSNSKVRKLIRKDIIAANVGLTKKFNQAVNELLDE